jgi:hypothetical protein
MIIAHERRSGEFCDSSALERGTVVFGRIEYFSPNEFHNF